MLQFLTLKMTISDDYEWVYSLRKPKLILSDQKNAFGCKTDRDKIYLVNGRFKNISDVYTFPAG